MRLAEYLSIGVLDGDEGSNLKHVVSETGLTTSWASLCLANLEKRGLVKKEKPQKKGYRNQVFFSLTEKGMEMKKYFCQVKDRLGLSWADCKEYKHW